MSVQVRDYRGVELRLLCAVYHRIVRETGIKPGLAITNKEYEMMRDREEMGKIDSPLLVFLSSIH